MEKQTYRIDYGHRDRGGEGKTNGKSNLKLTFSSVQFNRSVVSNSLQPHELQHARGLPVHHQLPEFTKLKSIESVIRIQYLSFSF